MFFKFGSEVIKNEESGHGNVLLGATLESVKSLEIEYNEILK